MKGSFRGSFKGPVGFYEGHKFMLRALQGFFLGLQGFLGCVGAVGLQGCASGSGLLGK